MSLLGLFALYLGVEFFYTTLGVFFSHHWYILRCLFNFNLDHRIPSLVPIESGLLFKIDMLVPFVVQTYYCCLVGKLFHVTHLQRDIAFAIGMCTHFVTKPQVLHLKAALTVFQYFKNTTDLCLFYHRGENVVPHGYSNSDY
jgi:hypothetical protein